MSDARKYFILSGRRLLVVVQYKYGGIVFRVGGGWEPSFAILAHAGSNEDRGVDYMGPTRWHAHGCMSGGSSCSGFALLGLPLSQQDLLNNTQCEVGLLLDF